MYGNDNIIHIHIQQNIYYFFLPSYTHIKNLNIPCSGKCGVWSLFRCHVYDVICRINKFNKCTLI